MTEYAKNSDVFRQSFQPRVKIIVELKSWLNMCS